VFFFDCPKPSELIETKRDIRPGMSVEEAERIIGRNSTDRHETDWDSGKALSQADGFSGYLFTYEPCSIQCLGELVVDVRSGRVTRVRVFLYNDLTHSTREIE
jgi:hypothetical protein